MYFFAFRSTEAKLLAPMYTFRGNKLTEYEATQYRRKIERNIRRFIREKYAMESAGLSSDFAKSNLAEWRKEQKIFHEQTGLKRQYDREKISYKKETHKLTDGSLLSSDIPNLKQFERYKKRLGSEAHLLLKNLTK